MEHCFLFDCLFCSLKSSLLISLAQPDIDHSALSYYRSCHPASVIKYFPETHNSQVKMNCLLLETKSVKVLILSCFLDPVTFTNFLMKCLI